MDPTTGLPDSSQWQCKRKNTRPLHLCSSSLTPDCEPHLGNPDSSREGGTVLEEQAYSALPSTGWGLKPFSISSKLCLCIFHLALVGRQSQDLGCINMTILQARILEWVAVTFSRGSSQPRDQTQVSHIQVIWATKEAPSHDGMNSNKNYRKLSV